MASQLFALLAASGLVATGAPDAHKTTTVAKPSLVAAASSAKPALVTAALVKPAGTCFVAAEKGKLPKLADIRKARAAGKCANNLMEGGAVAGAGAGVGAGAGTSVVTTLVTVGASVAASVGINQAVNNSSTPNI